MQTLTDAEGQTYQIITANDIPPSSDGRLRLESTSIQQTRKLPGGVFLDLVIEYNAVQPITLEGYASPKASSSRPLQGTGVSDGRLVLTGSGEKHVILSGGYWTVQP